jgi:hypothetical protein
MTRALIRTVVTIALASLVWAPVMAEEPEKSEDRSAETKGEAETRTAEERAREAAGSVVITNDVLADLYGPGRRLPDTATTGSEGETPTGQKPADAAAGPPDPVKAMRERQARDKQRRAQAEEARTRVLDLKQRVADLEKRALAIRNPLLPRPVVPEEQQDEWSSMGAVQRLEMTQEELAQARADLDAAEKELARLERGQ